MGVLEAVEAELDELSRRDPVLAASGLAATAVALAREIDNVGNSATSKSMCAKALIEALEKIKALAPAEEAKGKVDELQARRKSKLRAAGT